MTAERADAKMVQMNPGSSQGSPLPFRIQVVLKPALLLTLTVALALAAMVSLGTRGTDADPSFDSEEQAFLTLINDYRAQNGRAPLSADCRLNAAADWFANDMAIDNYWPSNHHDNEDPPRSPSERVAAFGFNGPVGENIAGGYTTAAAVFQAWKESSGHNSNMLRESYVAIGIGRAYHPNAQFGWYWVTDFALYVPPPAQPACAPPSTPPPTAPPATTSAPTSTPATPTPAATPTPTPSQTAEPTPQPTPEPLVWGDTDCDDQIGPLDSIRVLRLDAGLATTTPGTCLPMGGALFVNGTLRLWGDVNCDGPDPVDAILMLRYDAGLPVQVPAGCPSLGEPV